MNAIPQPLQERPPASNARFAFDLLSCVLLLVALLLWDGSGLDLNLVRLYGDAAGFAWREHWLTRQVLHEGGRSVGWVVMAVLVINIWRPLPMAQRLSQGERVWWVLATLACLLVIPTLKQASHTSCPWSLAEFGGSAHYVSHWAFAASDGGPGGCFPSGHASAAFSFLPGWFALRNRAPLAARRWLAVTVLVGLTFGWAQMMRGAHYPSHTFWTAWVCLALSSLLNYLFRRRLVSLA